MADSKLLILKQSKTERYAVAKLDEGALINFYTGDDSIEIGNIERARMYDRYKDAEAVADFSDEKWFVVDLYDFMNDDQRLLRAICCDKGFDDGNEKAFKLPLPWHVSNRQYSPS